MKSPKATARLIGILLVLHLATELITPYVILQPLTNPLTFTANNPASAWLVRLSVMLLFIGGAVTIAIAITAMPVLRRFTPALAVWIVGLAFANFVLQCVENAAWMSMFTFSQNFGNAAPANVDAYKLLAEIVRANWKWVHYTHLLVMVMWMLLFFVTVWRARLVPGVIAALGVITTLMQITGITLPQFIPYPAPPRIVMGLPLAFVYVALAVWLMIKGFGRRAEATTNFSSS